MAVSDEDWQKFLNATEPDDDEETDPESEDDELETEEEDKDKKAGDKSGEGDEDDPDDEEEDPEEEDPDEDPEEDTDKYKPRLKQFINKDGSYNVKGIEKSYVDSGKNAVKLNQDLKASNENYGKLLGAIKANPDAAKAIFGEEGAKQLIANKSIPSINTGGTSNGNVDIDAALESHPLIKGLKAQQDNRSRKEYNDFVDAHPEAATDPGRADKIGEFLKIHGNIYRDQNGGESPTMKESLESAYKYYGWDLETDKKGDVASAAKKTAATQKTGKAKRSGDKKPKHTKDAQFFAKKLGVDLK